MKNRYNSIAYPLPNNAFTCQVISNYSLPERSVDNFEYFLPYSELCKLEKDFIFEERELIRTYLLDNRTLIPKLIDSSSQIYKIFGPSVNHLNIRSSDDFEEIEGLSINIKSSASFDERYKAFKLFIKSWFTPLTPEDKMKLSVQTSEL